MHTTAEGDLDEARPLYEQAAAIAQTIGDKLDEAGALTNIANIKNDQGDRDRRQESVRGQHA